jgi:hypothetical protein
MPIRAGSSNVLFSTCGQTAADLSVTAQDSADPVQRGTAATYTVTVTNHAPDGLGATANFALAVWLRPNTRRCHFTAATAHPCTGPFRPFVCAGNLATANG